MSDCQSKLKQVLRGLKGEAGDLTDALLENNTEPDGEAETPQL